ncbi:MAG: hypothetical protein LKF58_03340 [Bacilli bacterium]|nr:hypothetical protein [Bacilli bacterium]MCH4277885.1 hypothetical protein [Bacilli bacterium]
MKWFNKQPRLLQILLLLIPGVNWVVEVILRVSAVLQKTTVTNILGLIFGVFVPVIGGWIDVIWCLLFKHLLLAK